MLTCRNFDVYLHAKKLTSSLTSFLRYCKDIANLLFWKLWECLTMPMKIIVSVCSKLSCLSAWKKIKFITYFFLQILQRNSKLVLLGTLDMPGYVHSKWYYQLVGNFYVYLHAKIRLHPSSFFLEILQSYFGYFGHAWSHTHTPKMIVSTCRRLRGLSASQK